MDNRPFRDGHHIGPSGGSGLMAADGRLIKSTPERFEQIRNLVERGMSREQIAETIGVTVGSLQVTCSRHGISLRRPKLNIWEHDPTTVLSPRSIVSTGEGERG